MEIARAIVTGGAGFIGSHLVDALLARGAKVTVIDKAAAPAERHNAAADYRLMDIRDAGLRAVFEEIKPDVVFHLAAHIDDRESMRLPVLNAEENILGTLAVCEAARVAGAKKMVFASTGVVYGNAALPTSEEVVPKPLTPYGVSKLAGERYLNFYWLLYKLPYVALRLSNVYGPRQDGSKEVGAVAIFTKALLHSKTSLINNDGLTTRDYVYVGDVITAMMAAATGDAVGVYNIGTGVETTTRALYEMVAAAVGVASQPNQGDQQDIVKRVALSAEAAKKALHWQPTMVLADGIAATVRWYREHLVV